jgi:hypothetical protein
MFQASQAMPRRKVIMRRAFVLSLVLAASMAFAQDKKKTYNVSGFVGKSASEAAPGVIVALLRKDSGDVFGTARTNFFGKYTIKEVPPGLYVLRVEKIQRSLDVKDKSVRIDVDLSDESGVMDYAKSGVAMIQKENEAKAAAQGSTQGGPPGEPPGPSDPEMMKAIAGEYYHFSGSTEKKIMFCPDGVFSDSSESGYSGKGSDGLGNQNLAWGTASQNQGSGQWAIQGNAQSGTITLSYRSGKRVAVNYRAGREKGCYTFNGNLFCYSGAARCR